MPQNTNLNISPYFDDFDKDKNFYRVLYRPGFPIQARELTTMQSILQNQIESMGQHFFKEGSMVIPGQIGYDLDVKAVILQQNFLGVNVENYRDQLTGQVITGVTSGVKAKVLYSIPATESTKGYITLYVKYIDSGDTVSDETVKGFLDNEQLYAENEITFGTTLIEVSSPFAQLLPAGATEVGSVAYINAGVYFIRGYFVDVQSAHLLLDQYTNNPSYRIGLEVSESINVLFHICLLSGVEFSINLLKPLTPFCFIKSSGSIPSLKLINLIVFPGLRLGIAISINLLDAFLPASSPSKHIIGESEIFQISLSCLSVIAVPSGATTLMIFFEHKLIASI